MLRYAIALAFTLGAPVALAAPAAPPANQARDHASILAMAGTYKVTFDMRETVSFVPGYTLYPAKISGGHEVVRVVTDTPDHVVLQHLLVVDGEGMPAPVVVKHWRQDWTWQPATVLSYTGAGQWAVKPVSKADRAGAWSQTVWQTDDSPRYGAVGRWRYDDGVARWTSPETERPLARRDATRHPPYDRYIGTNRHALTPTGWVHEQDNAKIGTKDGASVTFAHEVLLNSYVADKAFSSAPADNYWEKTKTYWAFVRDAWDRSIARHNGLRLKEEADAGSVTGHQLMLIADDIAKGEVKLDAAIKEAAELIDKESAK